MLWLYQGKAVAARVEKGHSPVSELQLTGLQFRHNKRGGGGSLVAGSPGREDGASFTERTTGG